MKGIKKKGLKHNTDEGREENFRKRRKEGWDILD